MDVLKYLIGTHEEVVTEGILDALKKPGQAKMGQKDVQAMAQGIYSAVSSIVPDDFDKFIVTVEYDDTKNSSTAKLTAIVNGKTLDNAALVKGNVSLLTRIQIELDKVIRPIRNKLSGKDKWMGVQFILQSDGKFNFGFRYPD